MGFSDLLLPIHSTFPGGLPLSACVSGLCQQTHCPPPRLASSSTSMPLSGLGRASLSAYVSWLPLQRCKSLQKSPLLHETFLTKSERVSNSPAGTVSEHATSPDHTGHRGTSVKSSIQFSLLSIWTCAWKTSIHLEKGVLFRLRPF